MIAGGRRRPRVLMLTSGPLDGHLGADTDLAMVLLEHLDDVRYSWFRKWPRPDERVRALPGRPLPIASRDGEPHLPERLQAAAYALAMTRRSDLVHALITIGPGFPAASRALSALVGDRPVLHTVPGVMDPALLRRSRPLGLTVALSQTTAEALRTAGFGDVRVVSPVIRMDRWPLVPRPSGDTPTILVTGHHDPQGGSCEAVTAAAVARRAGARFKLVLALRGRPGQDVRALEGVLRAQAQREGMPDTEVLGHVDDMPALLAAADILLYVPQSTGGKADVPLTVLQALATGRPVVLSELPQFLPLRDVVLRAPPGDCGHTGNLLADVLARPRWWRSLAERGRAAVEVRFAEAGFASQYARLYKELLP
ncbi:glycosyltransferase involved in cell wall biosynthesis [Streptomyces sp. SAI-170]|uniref:glycosyltransferase n=1 Tax=Streptomyces sp. SAI-170 TaxID=3377729 RepID=UPI003C7DAD6A